MTHRRVKVNEDGAGNIFTTAGLGEESLVGTAGANFIGDAGIVATVGLETVLEQVPAVAFMVSICERRHNKGKKDSQLPRGVTKLHTSLANVNVTDLTN